MKVLRTPDERFENLPGFPYDPKYVDVPHDGASLRMHYVDEGPRDGPIVLLLHGEPTWSYLYRKMIPPLVDGGLRAVAPDNIGFGRSDKLDDRNEYSYAGFVAWTKAFIEALELQDITVFGQDWGGLIGLRLVAENPDLFSRIVCSNTFMPTGDQPPNEAFLKWRAYTQEVEEFPIGWSVQRALQQKAPDDVVAAYDAPFPEEKYKEAARVFPVLVPASPEDPAAEANRKAWEVLGKWEKPVLTAFGDSDPVTSGLDKFLQQLIPGAAGQPHVTVKGGGHFIQEDKGEDLAQIVVDFVKST